MVLISRAEVQCLLAMYLSSSPLDVPKSLLPSLYADLKFSQYKDPFYIHKIWGSGSIQFDLTASFHEGKMMSYINLPLLRPFEPLSLLSITAASNKRENASTTAINKMLEQSAKHIVLQNDFRADQVLPLSESFTLCHCEVKTLHGMNGIVHPNPLF